MNVTYVRVKPAPALSEDEAVFVSRENLCQPKKKKKKSKSFVIMKVKCTMYLLFYIWYMYLITH